MNDEEHRILKEAAEADKLFGPPAGGYIIFGYIQKKLEENSPKDV